ncbi:MAG TPA: hypothetical protein VJ813_10840 [Vicinamibacterales bacterium]|nr:hypothetical protein [Vicinamibacterales bacterium]
MALTERERWLLNFYRNSELHGALLMGRLARTVADDQLLVEMTAHCATEARHAAMLSRAIASAGARLDPAIQPIQEHYSKEGGVPGTLLEVLVLSETLERRVRASYHRHLAHESPHPAAAETLGAIVAEMEAKHGAEHAGWIELALDRLDRAEVDAARGKWQAVDERVAARLERGLDERFGVRSL